MAPGFDGDFGEKFKQSTNPCWWKTSSKKKTFREVFRLEKTGPGRHSLFHRMQRIHALSNRLWFTNLPCHVRAWKLSPWTVINKYRNSYFGLQTTGLYWKSKADRSGSTCF